MPYKKDDTHSHRLKCARAEREGGGEREKLEFHSTNVPMPGKREKDSTKAEILCHQEIYCLPWKTILDYFLKS